MTAMESYRAAVRQRSEIIRQNASRRVRGLPTLPVPAKPEPPMAPFAYEADGTYAGRLPDDYTADDVPPGCHVRMERLFSKF